MENSIHPPTLEYLLSLQISIPFRLSLAVRDLVCLKILCQNASLYLTNNEIYAKISSNDNFPKSILYILNSTETQSGWGFLFNLDLEDHKTAVKFLEYQEETFLDTERM